MGKQAVKNAKKAKAAVVPVGVPALPIPPDVPTLPVPSPVQHMDARRDLAAFLAAAGETLTDEKKRLVVLLLKDGATLAEVVRIPGFASFGAIAAARKADPLWDADVQSAIVDGAAAMIAQAQTYAFECVGSHDVDTMRMADILTKCTALYAEKLAPRDFGQLVKLAGDETLAPITLSVVQYGRPVEPDSDTFATGTHASSGSTAPRLAHDVADEASDQAAAAIDGIG